MTSLTEQRIYQRQRELQDEGWEWDVSNFHAVDPHSGHETLRHYLVKAAIANRISNRPGRFVSEASHPQRGQADIIDLRVEDPKAIVIEVETDASRERILAKAEQYTGPCIRDVCVVDPTDAPDSVDDWGEWLEGELL
jgi:hypothetical protein